MQVYEGKVQENSRSCYKCQYNSCEGTFLRRIEGRLFQQRLDQIRYRASRYCLRDIKAFSASCRSNSHIHAGSAALYQVTVLVCLHRQPGNHFPLKKYFICHYYKCLFLACNNSNSYSLIFLCVKLEQVTLQFVKSVTFQRQSVKLLDFQLREKKKTNTFYPL